MTISQASIEAALAEVARHGSVKDAAKATRRPRGYFDYRLKIASERGIDHNTKPRFRVPARLCGTQAPDFSDPPPIRPEALYSTPAEASPPSTTTLSVVVIGDTHDDPHISKERFTWLGKFAADIGPDHIVQIGDLADIESLSFHSRNETESGRYKPRFMADMESMRRAVEMLTEPLEKANATAKRHITLGNHEHRVWRFEDTAPETSGMLQRDFTSVLADHQWGWHKYGRFLEIGGVGLRSHPDKQDGQASIKAGHPAPGYTRLRVRTYPCRERNDRREEQQSAPEADRRRKRHA